MPELPDLEVFSANLDHQLAGERLQKIVISPRKRSSVSVPQIKKAIEGEQVKNVIREGKELWFIFHNNQVLALHLMLRGKLEWFDDNKVPPHTLMKLYFGNGNALALSDYQYNARITLNPPSTNIPDAASKDVNLKFWKDRLKSRATIKNLILDQKVVRGIGNAYADEILWTAGISPFSISNKIPSEKIDRLSKSVKKVLTDAEKQIRKKAPGIIGGEIRDFLLVHNSKRKHSPGGAPIKVKRGSRKTYYTDEQQLFK